MRIAVLGAGAMGLLFGGLLSRKNDVCIYGHRAEKVEEIKKNGVIIRENDGTELHLFPRAAVSGEDLREIPDVVMLFTKSLVSREVLEQNRGLFGPDTLLLTLQNGSGHEELLREFVEESRIVIGTTRHNSVLTGNTSVLHGGSGVTSIGSAHARNTLVYILAEEMSACGIETSISEDIRRFIWDKLFVNTSVSVVSGILQVPQGYLLDNPHAWSLVERLAREAVETARSEGFVFKPEKVLEGLHSL
ncbi:MAG: ketopantoate reductase family protein, partial [Hungatella hathewayi]|nr:ketopantoate reductase family protein [Hungatella hathewayi]